MTTSPAISVVIVSWQSGQELLRCVASLADARRLAKASGLAVSLVVVDNASATFPGDDLRTIWPDIVMHLNTSNLGFAAAANQGARLATAGLLLFLNPDTVAVGDPFTPLASAAQTVPHAVAFAPRLLQDETPEHETQEEFQLRHLPTFGQVVREQLLVDRLLPHGRFRRADRYADADRSAPFAVEQPAASALAIRRELFLAIGGFDEGFFPAWFEDVDLCARLRRHGSILFWPASVFRHTGGVSSVTLGYDCFLPAYYRNAFRYWRKHHGAVPAGAYRALLAIGMALRLMLLPLRPSVPRSRRDAARAYWRVLLASVGLDGSLRRVAAEVRQITG